MTFAAAATQNRRKTIIWLLILVAVCIPAVIVGSAFSESMRDLMPETLPFPSIFNRKASGASALFELTNKVGIKAISWQRPYRELDEDKTVKGTLVIILPWDALGENDIEHLVKWIRRGNDLVYFDYFTYRSGARILQKLSMQAETKTETREKEFFVADDMPETSNVKSLRISSEVTVSGGNAIAPASHDTYLTWTKLGNGRCLIGSVPEFCSNKYIGNPDFKSNFQFMMNWFHTSKGPIMFDERCHGYTEGRSVWFFILRSPVGFVMLQIGLILLIAALSLNQRFGQPVLISTARKISNLEFIDGLASTYQRARARDTAWAMMFAPLKARLCKLFGVAPDAPIEQLAQVWSDSAGKNEGECLEFLQRAQSALDKRALTDEELKRLVASADKLMR